MRLSAIIYFSAIVLIFTFQKARATYTPTRATVEKKIPEYLLVKNFIHISISDFQKVSGHKLGFLQKIYFKKLQKQLRKSNIYQDSNILPYYDMQKGKFKFDSLWFILGALIGPFAILFSFTAKQDKNKKISALIGFGVWIIWFGYIFLF